MGIRQTVGTSVIQVPWTPGNDVSPVRVGLNVVERLGKRFIGDQQEEEAMTPTLTPPPETVAFPGADERCDRCSAAAKLRVMIAGGGELVFCGHHANKYAEKLVKI